MNVNPWQMRIGLTRDNELQNIYFASHTQEPLERSFFKGMVVKVLPGIQTAFVEIGQERAGFLHISEVDRELAVERMSKTVEIDDDKPVRRAPKAPDIGKILKEGESILVQVSKEPVYEKGAKLTTCFTLPGRFLVLLPNIPRLAISKKIEEQAERSRLRDIMRAHLPEGMGAIIRTTAEEQTEKNIVQDLTYLLESWQTVQTNYNNAQNKECIFKDLPLALQIVRDHLDDDVDSIIVDDNAVYKEVFSFVNKFAPDHRHKVKHYTGPQPLFEKYELEKQIEGALKQKVELKSGGSIIIEPTQAMTVVDVNTGRYIGKADMEQTLLKTNLEAADEIVRQLRLRNIGGLIVIDFIDMAHQANRQKLFKHLESTLKERDKFQSVVLRVSEFGLVQMTRKRSGMTLQQELTNTCTCCHGLGVMVSTRSQAYSILNQVKAKLIARPASSALNLVVHPDILDYITNIEYNAVLMLERLCGCKITLESNDSFKVDHFELKAAR